MSKYTYENFKNAPVHLSEIVDELPKIATPNCFQGAWYRKCVSNRDHWIGIEALVVLPEFYPDPERLEYFEKENHLKIKKPYQRPLDSPSIYLGGFAGFETDIGFGFNRGYVNKERTEVSDHKFAFVPFWRYIYPDENQVIKNIYKLFSFEQLEFYFYPGDKIRLSVFCPEENYLQLSIELVSATNIEKYINLRKTLEVKTDHVHFLSPFIPSPGQGVNKAEFKRVNAIDQFYNEGKRAKNTNAYTTETIWEEVYLYRIIGDKLVKVPFNEDRYAEMSCPIEEAIKINYQNVNKKLGGERAAIVPKGVNY
ncbi:MAG: hypothetical protein K0Q49_1574 [Haloplasmataceae bacterium]|jgi:REP element-mobilizing transposase RayT|nr:hypothetical protein [Haloplasmataceae bacterium]